MQKPNGQIKNWKKSKSMQLAGAKETVRRKWQSFRERIARPSVQPMIPELPIESSYSIYQSCRELPLNLFIRCIVESDYAALIISGNPTPEQLKEAWFSIYSDYLARIGGASIISFLRNITQINILQSKITRVQSMVDCLRLTFSYDLATGLKESGYKIADPEDQEAFTRSLIMIESKLKVDQLKLEKLLTEIPEGDAKKPTAEGFDETLTQISMMVKFDVNDTINVASYCGYVKALKKHFDALTQMKNYGRNK